MLSTRPLAVLAALITFVAITPSAALAAPTPKDKADAKALVNDAKKALKDKRWTEAVTALQQADKLDPSPALELDLALAQISAGKLIDASKALEALGAGTDSAPAAKKTRDAAQKALAELKPRVPTVKVIVTGPTGKVSVIVDGHDADATSEIPVDPGHHTVGASADGYNPAEKELDLAAGARESVELALTPTAVAPVKAEGSSSRLPAIIVTSVGGVGIALGALFGGVAIGATKSVKAKCTGTVCPVNVEGEISSAKTLGNVSTGMFVVGGVAAAAGVALLVLNPWGSKKKDEPSKGAHVAPWFGAEQVGIAGTF